MNEQTFNERYRSVSNFQLCLSMFNFLILFSIFWSPMQLIFVLLVGSEKLFPSYRKQRTSFVISQLDKVTNYLSLICIRKDICLLCDNE